VQLDARIRPTSFDPLQLQRALANLVDNAIGVHARGRRDHDPDGASRRRRAGRHRRRRTRHPGRSSGIAVHPFSGRARQRRPAQHRSRPLHRLRDRRDGSWFTIELPLGEAEEPQRAVERAVPLAAAPSS
jgi:hypothetical protein